jgi:hypothetical protein
MITYVPAREETENTDSETRRLRAENTALKMALSVAQRERDEWRTLAEQCAPLGGEVDDWEDSPWMAEDKLCAR